MDGGEAQSGAGSIVEGIALWSFLDTNNILEIHT